nr:cell division protein [Bifidobacterium primatium]
MDDVRDGYVTPDNDDTGESEVANRMGIHGNPADADSPTQAPAGAATNDDATPGPVTSYEEYSEPYSSVAIPAPTEPAAAPYRRPSFSIPTVTNGRVDLDDSTNIDRPKSAIKPNAQTFQRMLMEDDDDEDLTTKNQFTTVYDLLDQLEELVDASKGSFFSGTQVRVDREEITTLITELKGKLPVQLERASALMRESERRLENAQSQANAIIAAAQSRSATIIREANEQAQFLAGQENVVALATERAHSILDQAQAKADKLTRGADNYSTAVLTELSEQLAKASHGVQNGLAVLAERQRQAAQDMPHLSSDDYSN